MSSTELARRDTPTVSLFPGATVQDVIAAASDASQQFSQIVRQQRMFKRIGDRDHIQIEAWQTIGALTNVFAVEADGVTELPWPDIDEPGDEPEHPGPEPRDKRTAAHAAWKLADRRRRRWENRVILTEQRASGGAFGYTATYRAVKAGQEVGWAEGRCDRTEPNWSDRDNFALASMAQTRGQSRALAAPLRFVVNLAGYETTPAEELDGAAPEPASTVELDQLRAELADAQARALTFADEASYLEAMNAAAAVRPDLDAGGLMIALVRAFKFDAGLPETVARALRIFKWWADKAAAGSERAMAPEAPRAPTGALEAQEAESPSRDPGSVQEAPRAPTAHEIEQERIRTYHQGGPTHGSPPVDDQGAPQ